MKNIIHNTLLVLSTAALLGSCGVNKAKQKEADKSSFSINEQQVQSLLNRKYNNELTGLTVFYLPNSDERSGETQAHRDDPNLEIDIHNADPEVVEEKRKIAKILIEVPPKIEYHANIAKAAGAFLQSEKTQCVNLLTAVQGMKICKEKEAEIQQGITTLTGMQAQMQKNIAAKKNELADAKDQSHNPELSADELVEINKNIVILEKTIEGMTTGLAQVEAKLNEVQAQAAQCASLPALYASLKDHHKFIPECVKKKQELDIHKPKAEELGMSLVLAVGPSNWKKTDATNSSLNFQKEKSEITLVFGLPNLNTYSTADDTITNLSWDPVIRSLKFHIHEKDQDGNLTGNIVKASLEQGAVGNTRTFSGSLKKYIQGKMVSEGKMSLTQEVKASQQ